MLVCFSIETQGATLKESLKVINKGIGHVTYRKWRWFEV